MKRLGITMLAIAMALVTALPAGAKKPDKPDKPHGFEPMACQVDVPVGSADVRNAAGTTYDVEAESGAFTLTAFESLGFNETQYTVEPPGTPELNDVLCVEITLLDGTLSDLRVRWLNCQNCGLYRATGKDLRNFNNGEVFSAGVSAASWTAGERIVAVMPVTKSDTATMTVTIGIDQP